MFDWALRNAIKEVVSAVENTPLIRKSESVGVAITLYRNEYVQWVTDGYQGLGTAQRSAMGNGPSWAQSDGFRSRNARRYT